MLCTPRATAMCAVSVAFAASATALPAIAQSFPAGKPVRIIVPFGPGSTIDIMGRLLSPKLIESLGTLVIVENRPGAGGAIGMDATARAAPDGHTLAIGALGPLAMNPVLYPKTPFDPVKDFAAVSLLATGPVAIVVHPSVPAKTIRELVALAKARPGQLSYGSPGVGSSPHLTGELFRLETGTNLVHVPYKGNAEALTDLIGGQISAVFSGVPPVVPLVNAGKVRALATTGKTRNASLPDAPTIAEAGVKGAEVLIWYGVVAPAATPKDVIARLNRDIVNAMATPDLRERFRQQGVDPETSTPEQFAQLIRDEFARWTKVIRTARIQVE